MPAVVIQCYLCGAEERHLFSQHTSQSHAIPYQRCLTCGLVYQSPRMTPQELDAFYESEYRKLYQGGEGPSRKDLLVQAGRAETLLSMIKERIPPPQRFLDIGASAGTLISRFAQHFQAIGVGVEPGAAYRRYAQERGLTMYPSLEALQKAGERSFDLISLAHVLEHLPDPVGSLISLRQDLLTRSGWLLLEVPNLYAHDSFEIAHLSAFSPHTVRQVLAKAGYQVIHLCQHGQPRSVILPLYLTVLAQPYPDSRPNTPFRVRKERAVGIKRRAGMFRRRLLERVLPDLAWLPIT